MGELIVKVEIRRSILVVSYFGSRTSEWISIDTTTPDPAAIVISKRIPMVAPIPVSGSFAMRWVQITGNIANASLRSQEVRSRRGTG